MTGFNYDYSEAERGLLANCIISAMHVKTEIAALNKGMNESVKESAAALALPVNDLKAAITCCYKGDWTAQNAKVQKIGAILAAAGQKTAEQSGIDTDKLDDPVKAAELAEADTSDLIKVHESETRGDKVEQTTAADYEDDDDADDDTDTDTDTAQPASAGFADVKDAWDALDDAEADTDTAKAIRDACSEDGLDEEGVV